jgi:hypothetical protein
MRRALIMAVGIILLAAPSRAGDFSEGPKIVLGYGPWRYEAPLFGNGNSQSGGQYQSHRHYVISPTDSFAGSYYVEAGNYYFQPPAGPRQAIEQGSFNRVDDLAKRLEYEASTACIEMNDNYRDNPGYAKTYKEAFRFYEVAHDLDASAQKSDRTAVAENEQKLSDLLDAVRKDTNGWSRHQNDQHGHEQHGQGGLQAKLDRLESLSRHLSHDVESSTTTSQPASQTANAGPVEKSLLVK